MTSQKIEPHVYDLPESKLDKLFELSNLLDVKLNEIKYNKWKTYFPDEGMFPRKDYPKHVLFIEAGAHYRQRAFIAANRVGKTLTAAFELRCHLTGDYPKWWRGKKFLTPIEAWCAGISNESTRDIIQLELLGDDEDYGTGMIEKSALGPILGKSGSAGAVGIVYVRHKSGGYSKLGFKSYEQGWKKFQGTKKQVIWLDEEPVDDPKIYSECAIRTMDKFNPGILMCTFTPLSNYSTIVESFLPNIIAPENGVDPENPYKFVVCVGWDQVPHLSEEDKKELLLTIPIHERDARSKGIPGLGSGRIFRHSLEHITCEQFEIPEWWPRAYGFDVGTEHNAIMWLTKNPETNEYFFYAEYHPENTMPVVIADAIKLRGKWIEGVIDTQSKQINPTDGKSLWGEYRERFGLNLTECEKNGVKEASIMKMDAMLLNGQLKIFNNLEKFLKQYLKYRRDDKGDIVKKDDHGIDAALYVLWKAPYILTVNPTYWEREVSKFKELNDDRDECTGY